MAAAPATSAASSRAYPPMASSPTFRSSSASAFAICSPAFSSRVRPLRSCGTRGVRAVVPPAFSSRVRPLRSCGTRGVRAVVPPAFSSRVRPLRSCGTRGVRAVVHASDATQPVIVFNSSRVTARTALSAGCGGPNEIVCFGQLTGKLDTMLTEAVPALPPNNLPMPLDPVGLYDGKKEMVIGRQHVVDGHWELAITIYLSGSTGFSSKGVVVNPIVNEPTKEELILMSFGKLGGGVDGVVVEDEEDRTVGEGDGGGRGRSYNGGGGGGGGGGGDDANGGGNPGEQFCAPAFLHPGRCTSCGDTAAAYTGCCGRAYCGKCSCQCTSPVRLDLTFHYFNTSSQF
ncbi:hypothetical protein ACP70R_040632 [Stipagrostis hirtigluma subsp. patula]